MKDKNITIMSLEDAVLQTDKSEMDWEQLRREKAAGVEPEIDPDEGKFDSSRTGLFVPPPKIEVSIQLDADIVDYFKGQGSDYQIRINAVLRKFMKENRKAVTSFSNG